ncbi:MAG: aminotransferase class III-fold pyridoxal phosphate-dependent enzyme [bacterium]
MNHELIDRYQTVISPVIGHFTDLIIKKGEGCYLIDEHGKAYLDFACGIGVTSTGHCHPKVVAALQAQAEQLLHCSIGMGYYEQPIALAEALNTKISGDYQAYFCQSGAEAVEAALKLSLYVQKRGKLLSYRGGFHGRTMGALSVTSKQKYRDRYDALLGASVDFLEYPDPYRADWVIPDGSKDYYYNYLSRTGLFDDAVAAVIIECIQGEGGYIPAPFAYLKALEQLCKEQGIFLILDEIQSGIGRSGDWFSFQAADISPDIITLAKGLGSGVPIGACLAKTTHMQQWDTSHHGSTYGGNPFVCSAALATLEVLTPVLDSVASLGTEALVHLKNALANHPFVGDIRGRGLMIGIELVTDKTSKTPNPDLVTAIRKQCLDKGLLLIFCGEDGHIIRLIPPLVIDKQTLFNGLDILISVLNASY